MLDFRLLGPLEVSRADETLPIRRQKQRALAAALALRPGQPVSAERLVDDLWGEDPPRMAKDALQNYVSQLRKLLGRATLATHPAGYVLDVERDQVDLFRFERLIGEARELSAAERELKLREALSLVRGPVLADLALEPFAGPEIVRIEELELQAREELVDAELELGRHADVVSELEALIARQPYRERLRAQLMLALYRCGRQAEALDVFRDARQVLVDELGIEPGEELRHLEHAILRQDDSLRAPPSRERLPASKAVEVAPRPRRKTVTVVFAAPAWPEGDEAPLDPEARRERLERFAAAGRAAAERHGGSIEETSAEELIAIFGIPIAHENDALRAVRAAVELHAALESESFGARAGVCTGEVFVTGHRPTATGGAVTLAERLAEAAAHGEIFIGDSTLGLVREAVDVEERAEGEFRLVGLRPDAARRLRRDSPMVGRGRQLTALKAAFESAVADGVCHLFTVLGSAGVGKSRLASEFVSGLDGGVVVLGGRCPSYGEGITFLPLLEVAGQAARISEDLAERVAEIAGAEHEGSIRDTHEAARTLFTELAGRQPLVVLFDDLQWAEPAFLDLVEHVVETARQAPMLMLCLARPELLEERPTWGGGKTNASTVLLEPLSEGESEQLLDNLLGESDLPQPVRAHIVRGAEGNPFFVEELLALLVERDVLRREGGRWTTTELAVPRIPPSIHALLAARIDRLPEQERVVLEVASIQGKVFHRRAVAELGAGGIEDAEAVLAMLVRKELVRPVPADEQVLQFRHQLIRDATYEAMPKRIRSQLHEQFATWLERQPASPDVDEVVGYHLEQAYRYLAELGTADEGYDRLGARAAGLLAAAGRRATARGDDAAAAKLLRRASALSGR